MAGSRPKLAAIDSVEDFSHWLAETIQEKAAKENAGFVQIERRGADLVTVSSHGAGRQVRFVLRMQAVLPGGDQ